MYDLWGRGYSQAPYTIYDEALYTSQLAMLLQKVGWENTDVIGVSLGGKVEEYLKLKHAVTNA